MPRSTPLNLEAVRHSRLSDNIAAQLERLIVNNELHVGDALPSERELAAQLQVSRNILREAISMLAQKGLVEVRPGSGTFVASPTTEFLRDSLELFLRLSGTALLDLVEARRSIEVEIAELAATRATAEDCQRILSALASLESTTHLPEAYVDADIQFHAELAAAAKNPILEFLLESIRGATRENIRVVLLSHPSAVEEAMGYHRRIALAVQSHSAESARTAMREHLESVRRLLQQSEPDVTAAPLGAREDGRS